MTNFLAPMLEKSEVVIDVACGAGAPTAYMASQFLKCSFLGFDSDASLIRHATHHNTFDNCKFYTEDLYSTSRHSQHENIDGVTMLCTLSWLENFYVPLKLIFQNWSPQWIGVSSLFYDGPISAYTQVIEHDSETSSHYNTYSLTQVRKFVNQHDYEVTRVQPFTIPVNLMKPTKNHEMKTYTISSDDVPGGKLQISGPILMNWHFLLMEKRQYSQ